MKGRVWLPALILLMFAGALAMSAGQRPHRSAGTAADEAGDNRYYVVFRQFSADAPAEVRRAGGQLPEFSAVAAHLPPAALEALSRNPNIVKIERDPRRYLMSQAVPYGIPMVQADLLSDSNAANRTVCIIDSGYYFAHEDLPQHSGITGTDDVGAGPWDQDGLGHGTHVAGTIAALNNGLGVLGVLPNGNVKLHIVRVFNANGDFAYSSDLAAALGVCRNHGANVVNMSLGGPVPSTLEQLAFDNAFAAGVLSVAAAGNAGTTALSYPASYNSVISVAAVDSNKLLADFSQRNAQVELAAPGVGVESTVPYRDGSLTVDGVTYPVFSMEFATRTAGVTAVLADGGLCDTSNVAWTGKMVLCARGDINFSVKVQNVINAGGVAAVIYNNVPGNFLGTLGSPMDFPAVSLAQADGQFLVANKLGVSATLVSTITQPASGYAPFDGTSMATPHVAGVAALIWSLKPNCTNAQIRTALQTTAEDLGAAGRDTSYGFGLVRAKNAHDALNCKRRNGQTTSE
jgi:subtilisin family serine protease